jgi:hypothetical protein
VIVKDELKRAVKESVAVFALVTSSVHFGERKS